MHLYPEAIRQELQLKGNIDIFTWEGFKEVMAKPVSFASPQNSIHASSVSVPQTFEAPLHCIVSMDDATVTTRSSVSAHTNESITPLMSSPLPEVTLTEAPLPDTPNEWNNPVTLLARCTGRGSAECGESTGREG